jgi:6-pyruvoyltetrahydropterin/6-carboxytetrahydropterin synthase
MLTVFATFSFEAAHFLPFVSKGHKCGRVHGHNWTVEISARGALQTEGWIIDYYDLQKAWLDVYSQIDHRLLNDIEGLENPTAESIAPWIGSRLRVAIPSVFRVCVRETPNFGVTWELP